MSEHYTKATTEAVTWCEKCWRETRHAVSGGRLAHCLEHYAPAETKAQQKRREKREREAANPLLFA